ncbi:MAG TPA: c-type cytochrome [Candidatus Angelobacter sp.]|nr:c-type cytochrome [Candidatus Angelobacter sp.]
MKKFIIGLIIGLLLPVVGGYLFIKMGGMPMAASGATPLPMELTVARMSLKAATAKSADKTSPVPADEINLTQGAHVYVANCAFCHGLPGQPASNAAKGMFPLPPQLLNKDEMVTDDPIGITYWKVSNGIRLTGMPGFTEMLTDSQIWQVSQMLKNADKLPASTMAELTKPAEAPTPASPAQSQPQKPKK